MEMLAALCGKARPGTEPGPAPLVTHLLDHLTQLRRNVAFTISQKDSVVESSGL